MSIVFRRCLCSLVVFHFAAMFLDIRTDATQEGSSTGHPDLPFTQEPVALPHILRVSEVKASHGGHAAISRQKRNILFPSGVKLCAQETAQQVVANHLNYFHLRVCQETVWEAFKIFWDRLPEQEEYQSWMSRCQEGAVTTHYIGSFFSQSDEHQSLVRKRMSLPGLKSEPTTSWQQMCSTPTPDTPEAVDAPAPVNPSEGEPAEDATAVAPQEEGGSQLDNDIAVQAPTPTVLEQVVEMSILLTGELYGSDDLGNPASLQYQTLSRQLTEKIEDALEGLPGFRGVSVIDLRPQKDADGVAGVWVDYAVTVVVDGDGVSAEQLDYLTLQSNLVESSYRVVNELPTVVYAMSEVKNFFTEALHNEEPESVSEVPVSVNAVDGVTVNPDGGPPDVWTPEVDAGHSVQVELSETNTVATAQNDVVVLEESQVEPPSLEVSTSATKTTGLEEEGLFLENTVHTPPANLYLPVNLQAGAVTLPEPPVEIEASGSSVDDLVGPTEPSTTGENQEEVPSEEADTETDASEVETVIEAAAAEVELTTGPVEEVDINEVELSEGQEVGIIATETVEELAAQVPLPETEGSEAVETDLLPGGEEPVEEFPMTDEEISATQPEEDPTVIEVLSPVLDEVNLQDIGESEVTEESVPEAPVEETPQAPKISTEDLTEDEILLVNRDEPPLPDSSSPASPTALSPERESPFTRIADVDPGFDVQSDAIVPSLEENEDSEDVTPGDNVFDVLHYGFGLMNHTEEGSTGFPFGVHINTDQASIAMPANPGRALMVFFSLRVTNMVFSDDLFNKSSAEYKALEQRFLELLVPYLQSNLSHFENLEILNFRNGSIVVNSRMKFGKPVARGVTTTVYLILEDFCNTAYQTMNLAIDKYSLDVESGDQADPCKFQACNEYAECKVNKWSGEAECVCNAGYFSVDGLPCQSICELQTDFCLNDGKCDIIPGQGAICRCRVGENWWYRGEHCEEYVSEPLVVGIAIASVAGFLLVASGVIFFLARTLRDQYDKDESEDPIRRAESLPSLERATKYNPMYESEATTGYSHYYRRYPEAPVYSSASAEASTDFSSEEIRHIYENSELTKEEIQDRIRIIELYAKDRQFADFVRQHQAVLDTRRESSSAQT